MLALHVATRFEHDAIAEMREAREPLSNFLQKRIAGRNRERTRGGEYNVHLGVSQTKWRHRVHSFVLPQSKVARLVRRRRSRQ
jgi:hypothetical protein